MTAASRATATDAGADGTDAGDQRRADGKADEAEAADIAAHVEGDQGQLPQGRRASLGRFPSSAACHGEHASARAARPGSWVTKITAAPRRRARSNIRPMTCAPVF